jgi:hypothetical protein
MLPLCDLRRQIEVNVIGQVATTQLFLPLVRTGAGRVVFVGSVGGVLASQFAGAYHASKFAIEAIGDVWRQELEPEGIPVVLIEPSAISTPIWTKAIAYLAGLRASGSPRVERYRARLTSFRESLESSDEHGKSADDVAEVIADASTTDKPDTRSCRHLGQARRHPPAPHPGPPRCQTAQPAGGRRQLFHAAGVARARFAALAAPTRAIALAFGTPAACRVNRPELSPSGVRRDAR